MQGRYHLVGPTYQAPGMEATPACAEMGGMLIVFLILCIF